MALPTGSRVGPYEVIAAIGQGGMGEVYRARDTRLGRDVALKILPEAFAHDADRVARFEREAQLLAALNHPNIGGIHGLEDDGGTRTLVLEFVDGPTLADRIVSGALPIDEAMAIAGQIAEALEAAHEQGIIHRDLKPSNIKVRTDGTVKVLDFGLAKVAQASGSSSPASAAALTVSPTITTPAMTQVGVILGTAAYMSPEQAKGREADKRSDVWAFGAVLYEMLTGRRAFDGDDMSDTLASVLKIEPDWTLIPGDVPAAVRTLVQKCLAKDRRERVSDLSAATFVLGELKGGGSPVRAASAGASAAAPQRHRSLTAVLATAVLTTAVAGAAAWAWRPVPSPGEFSQFSFTLPEGQSFSGFVLPSIAISPDGTGIAYTANSRVYLRSISDLTPHAISGTEVASSSLGVTFPIFSPDGKSIAYFGGAASSGVFLLKRIPTAGGVPSTLATIKITDETTSASWGPAGILLGGGSIQRVPENGGAPERILSVGADEEAQAPRALPDGRTILFTLAKRAGADRWDTAKIVAYSLRDQTRRVLIEGASDARYLPTGHLIYAIGGTVYARPFRLDTLTLEGSQVPVVVGVRRAAGGSTLTTHLAVSDNGTLVYRPGPAAAASQSMRGLVVGDGRGEPVPLKVPPAMYRHPRVSPDGTVVAVERPDGESSDVWLYDVSGRNEMRRLTFGGTAALPIWSADGRRVTFRSAHEGDEGLWRQFADGRGLERLTRASRDESHQPESWSTDGKHLLYSILKGGTYALWVYSADRRTSEPFGKVQSAETLSATFSPDGRWVAYAFTERAGGMTSPNRGVFVEPFPPTSEKHQAPKMVLDYHPVWAKDGASILYLPGANRSVVSVPITTRPAVTFGAPVTSPQAPNPGLLSLETRGYDVMTGGRFVSVAPDSGDGNTGQVNEIRIAINWFEELKRLAPID